MKLLKPYTGPPVLCSAIVDRMLSSKPLPHGSGLFRVTVRGKPGGPHDIARFYDIVARSEDEAAKRGLACFTRDMEGLHDATCPRVAPEPAPSRH